MAPSVELASLMMIAGALLVVVCLRNLLVPLPHYAAAMGSGLLRGMNWAGVAVGSALVTGSIYVAYLVWQLLLQQAACSGG
jgi:hypothetical protein